MYKGDNDDDDDNNNNNNSQLYAGCLQFTHLKQTTFQLQLFSG